MGQESLTVNWPSADLPPEEVAVRAQEEIANLKLRIEELESKRNDALKAAAQKGICVYGGYRFVVKKPAVILDEGILADEYGDVMDEYLDWYSQAHPPKLTKTDMGRFLRARHPNEEAAIITAISRPDPAAEETYTLMKMKEGKE